MQGSPARRLHTSFGGNDSIRGGARDDHLTVGTGRNTVDAKGGNNIIENSARDASTLRGGEGDDILMVGSSQSSVYFIVDTGDGSVDDGSSSDILGFEAFVAYGATFDDIAWLGTGDDAFYGGGAGDDGISFFLGKDTVSGGAGADQFIFARNQIGAHTITSFVNGQDQLHFASRYLPGGPGPGQLDPALLSFGAASGGAARAILNYSAATDITTQVWDRNGGNPAGATI